MEMIRASFEFELKTGKSYTAVWLPNKDKHYSTLKWEVAIYRGGGYRVSFYTDNRICEKNSKEYVSLYLKTEK